MWTIHASTSIAIVAALLPVHASGQYILNGDFEINNAAAGENQMDLTNAEFNAMVPDCFSFAQPGWANLDLITTAEWGGFSYNGDRFIGIGWTDRLAMRLSEPLTIGQTYQLSFHDRAWPGHCVGGISIGLSTTPTSMGTYIHNTSSFPVVGVWKLRVFSFVAPVAAEYITVLMSGFEGCWQHVDAFCLSAAADCATPTVINVPNVFTPNADGVNDKFLPFAGTDIISGSMEIYNRWGDLLFSTEDLDSGWDGTSNERLCPNGDYFYRLFYETTFGISDQRHGPVMLLR